MCCHAGNGVSACGEISVERCSGLLCKGKRSVELVAPQQCLAFGIVDQTVLGSCGSRGGHPSLKAARTAGGKQVVERGGDCLGCESRVTRNLGDRQRLVPPARLQKPATTEEKSRTRICSGLVELPNQQLPQERME